MFKQLSVWDPLVRIGHWTIVAAFAAAYFSAEELLAVHVWCGYVVGSVVLVRVLWGFVGPNRARFADFVYPPKAVLSYLGDLLRFRSKRYLGHSPAGGAMIIALLLMLAATIATGVIELGADKHAGPLASFYATAPAGGSGEAKTVTIRSGKGESGDRADGTESALHEIHNALANLTLILIVFHLAGVALASFAHRENLVLAMITGRKRPEST